MSEKPPREIPVKKDPNGGSPEKAPEKIPDTQPGEDNPRNPKEDV